MGCGCGYQEKENLQIPFAKLHKNTSPTALPKSMLYSCPGNEPMHTKFFDDGNHRIFLQKKDDPIQIGSEEVSLHSSVKNTDLTTVLSLANPEEGHRKRSRSR